MTDDRVTLAVPCRTDEPALGRTLAAAWAAWQAVPQSRRGALEVLVCLNGEAPSRPAVEELRGFARLLGVALREVDLDAPAGDPPGADRRTDLGPTVIALRTRRQGKAPAWNALRQHAAGATMLFMDADVSCAADAFGLLLTALDEHPDAVLASGKTVCAPHSSLFEGVMAAPYGVDFPNLSPQLYAARTGMLPARMPDNLLDPEHWLELTVGADRIVRAPRARVVIRLPATLRDFFRQRVRIEMAKVQLAAEHPHLAGRGAVQPGARAVLRALAPADLVRLAVYLALRRVAHAVARRRYQRGRTTDLWPQAGSTKRWDPT
jgi:hypothetical protein